MLIKPFIIIFYLLCPAMLWAHHTLDHQMLQTDPQQVIEATQQGISIPWIWYVFIAFIVIGLVFQWKKK